MITFDLILKLIFLGNFWCVGVYMNSEEGEIFYFLRLLTDAAPTWIYKPIIGCINCMASLHTIVVMIIYKYLVGFPEAPWWKFGLLWLIVAVILSGVNGIVYKLYDFLKTYVEALQNENTE